MSTPLIDIDQLSDRVVFIHPAIRCWTGKRHLQPEDLGLDRRQLPPEKLVALGNKCVIDPQEIQVFASQRAAVRRECLAVGTRFLSGFIVPETKAQGLLDRIDAIERDFNAERDRFLAKFDRMVEDWVAAHPSWERLIRDTGVTRDFVAERLAFAVQAFKIVAPGTVNHPGLAQATAGLADNLFQEVAQLARETLEKSYLGKASVTRRALRPLLALQQKLDGLAFLDRRVRPIVQSIEATLAALPRNGAIQDRDLQALIGLLSLLEDPQRLKAHGEELLTREAPAASVAWGSHVPLSLPTPEDEAAMESRSAAVAETPVPATDPDASDRPVMIDDVVDPPPNPDRSSVTTETAAAGDWFF